MLGTTCIIMLLHTMHIMAITMHIMAITTIVLSIVVQTIAIPTPIMIITINTTMYGYTCITSILATIIIRAWPSIVIMLIIIMALQLSIARGAAMEEITESLSEQLCTGWKGCAQRGCSTSL
jgi:hypothetical protein